MKKSLFAFVLILFSLFGQKAFADPVTLMAMSSDNTFIKPAIFPALALLVEAVAGWSATEVVVVGGVAALSTTGLVVSFQHASTPQPFIDIDWDFTGGDEDPFADFRGPKPPKLFNDNILKIIQLTIAGEVGYFVIKKATESQKSITSLQDQLRVLYNTNDDFKAQVDALQEKMNSGRPFSIPVLTNSGIKYRIFFPLMDFGLTAYEVYDPIVDYWSRLTCTNEGWFTGPTSITPELAKRLIESFTPDGAPGSDEWGKGLQIVSRASSRIKKSVTDPEIYTATDWDYVLVQKFLEGDCFGDETCLRFQKKIAKQFADLEKKWLGSTNKSDIITEIKKNSHELSEIFSGKSGKQVTNLLTEDEENLVKSILFSPDLLKETSYFVRCMAILDKLPEGDYLKKMLREILCQKFPTLPLCNGGVATRVQTSNPPNITVQGQEVYFVPAKVTLRGKKSEFREKFNEGVGKTKKEAVPEEVVETVPVEAEPAPADETNSIAKDSGEQDALEPFAVDEVMEVVSTTERPTKSEAAEVYDGMEQVKKDVESADTDYQNSLLSEAKYQKKLFQLEKKASELLEKWREIVQIEPEELVAQDQSTDLPEAEVSAVNQINDIVEAIDPATETSPELSSLSSRMRDIQSEAERLEREYVEDYLTWEQYEEKLTELEKRALGLMKEFREFIKNKYRLPDNVWEKGKTKAFNSHWLDIIIKKINGDSSKVRCKTALKIYRDLYHKLREIFVDANLWPEKWGHKPSPQ